ncbi:hypothetical protein [Microbacterium sp. 2FI]|uniref:hypothetical protein n=1 Tax=Microbacterium sp. 2FI TaxID=2502193 RepID=UPI0010F5B7C1|nr:hypothetical protein [Microbacterium sp. 2FI]
MASRQRLVEVNRFVRDKGLDDASGDGMVIGFARDIARRVDKAGDEAPLNLLRMYQSAMKDLQRLAEPPAPAPKVRRDAVEEPPAPELSSPPELKIVEESPLEKLRREKQERATG